MHRLETIEIEKSHYFYSQQTHLHIFFKVFFYLQRKIIIKVNKYILFYNYAFKLTLKRAMMYLFLERSLLWKANAFIFFLIIKINEMIHYTTIVKTKSIALKHVIYIYYIIDKWRLSLSLEKYLLVFYLPKLHTKDPNLFRRCIFFLSRSTLN